MDAETPRELTESEQRRQHEQSEELSQLEAGLHAAQGEEWEGAANAYIAALLGHVESRIGEPETSPAGPATTDTPVAATVEAQRDAELAATSGIAPVSHISHINARLDRLEQNQQAILEELRAIKALLEISSRR